MENVSDQKPIYKLDFILQGLPRSPNSYGSSGHRNAVSRHRKEWRLGVAQVCRVRRPNEPLERVAVVLTRNSASKMDFDNRVASFKPVIDGLKDAGIIKDDNDSVILKRDYPQGKAPKGEGYIRVQVTELTDADLNLCLVCGK